MLASPSPPTLGWVTLNHVLQESVTLALQLAFVGVIGGLAKSLWDNVQAKEAFRLALLRELGSAHRRLYSLRRTLAFRQRSGLSHTLDLSEEDLAEFSDIRNLLGEVNHTARWDRRRYRRVEPHLQAMRSYLEVIIDEFIQHHTEALDGLLFGLDPLHAATPEEQPYVLRFKAPYVRAKAAVLGSTEFLSSSEKYVLDLPRDPDDYRLRSTADEEPASA